MRHLTVQPSGIGGLTARARNMAASVLMVIGRMHDSPTPRNARERRAVFGAAHAHALAVVLEGLALHL